MTTNDKVIKTLMSNFFTNSKFKTTTTAKVIITVTINIIRILIFITTATIVIIIWGLLVLGCSFY